MMTEMFQPLVSIIVEAYNDEQNGLAPPAETIDALITQDFPLHRTELILAGSDAQIRIWRGMEDAWKSFGAVVLLPVDPAESHYWKLKNQGASVARGELLAFIDCDALPGPHWLRSMVEALQSGADVSIGPSQYRTSHQGANSPLMLAFALPTWSFALSRASRPGEPLAAALVAHNLGIRRELFLQYRFPLFERSFSSSVLFFQLVRAGARFSYQPEQRVAHGVTARWWLTRAHFRRGWETYEGRNADPSWPRLGTLEKLKWIEPIVLRMGLVFHDAQHWFRYARVVGVGGLRMVVIFPLALAASGVARTAEMVGMYAWLVAPRASEHQARF